MAYKLWCSLSSGQTFGRLTLQQAPTGLENEVSWPVKYLLNATPVYDEPRGAPDRLVYNQIKQGLSQVARKTKRTSKLNSTALGAAHWSTAYLQLVSGYMCM
jgi:hypothetical protein